MLAIFFNVVALVLIVFVVWWFWLSKPKAHNSVSNQIKILIEGGVYQPSNIAVAANKPIELAFVRKDTSPCSEYVVFDSLDISAKLAVDKPHVIHIKPLEPGEYVFGCQMKMYVGSLVAK